MIKILIIVILILFILYKLYHIKKIKKEHFDNINSEDITNQVNIFYNNKINKINNILNFIKTYKNNNGNINITNSDALISNNITVNNLYTNGYNKFNTLLIKGDLTMSDNLIINNNDINIVPRYMIIAWYNKYKIGSINKQLEYSIPRGWVLCDGKSYYIKNGIITEVDLNKDYVASGEIIKTPNLINKFVIGAFNESFEWINGNGDQEKSVNIKKFNSSGGSSTIQLTPDDIKHYHNFSAGPIGVDSNNKSYGINGSYKYLYEYKSNGYSGELYTTKLNNYKFTDNVKPIDIRPPYIKLYYIMKI